MNHYNWLFEFCLYKLKVKIFQKFGCKAWPDFCFFIILGYAYAMGICAVIIVDVTFVVNANHVEGTCEGVGIARINGSVLFVTPEEASRGLFGHVFLCREAIVKTLVTACEILSRIIVGGDVLDAPEKEELLPYDQYYQICRERSYRHPPSRRVE